MNTVKRQRYLVLSGPFEIIFDGVQYNDIMYYNLDRSRLTDMTLEFGSAFSNIYDILFDDTGVLYMAGAITVPAETPTIVPFATASFGNPSSVTQVGAYSNSTFIPYSIALYTNSNQEKILYAAGLFGGLYDSPPASYGLVYGPPTKTGEWQAGSNLLFDYFSGTAYHIVYKTGGSGLNGINN